MPLYTLQYVYQLSDFDTTGTNITPPDEQGARAQGTPPFDITLSAGATPQQITIDDDDANFNETTSTDSSQPLASPITIDGVTYPAGSHVVLNYVLTDDNGFEGFSITIGATNNGSNTTTAFITNQPMVPGQTYTFTSEGNIGNNNAEPYAEFACFTAGTMVETPDGPRLIDTLQPGDLVLTDSGARTLRWIGSRDVRGTGSMAPVTIKAGTLGATQDITVSPNHRVLVQGALSELVSGLPEILVAAKHLVNGTTIRQAPRPVVRYVHLMFEAHEILQTHGLQSESFYLDAQSAKTLDCDQSRELLDIFGLRDAGEQPTTPLAFPQAHHYEASLFAQALAA